MGIYMQASRLTDWPLPIQCSVNPMFLERGFYKSKDSHGLDTVISLLQVGVDEISKKCGRRPAKRLQSVLQHLRYIQYDALQYARKLELGLS